MLPLGAQIDNAPEQPWDFPVGTLLFKTFSFFEASGQTRPTETRLMRRMEDGDWDYGVWLWNEAGDDADLLEIKKTLPVTVTGSVPLVTDSPLAIQGPLTVNGDVRTQAKLSGIDTPVSIQAVTVDGSISVKEAIRIDGKVNVDGEVNVDGGVKAKVRL